MNACLEFCIAGFRHMCGLLACLRRHHGDLRRNPPQVRVTSGQKLLSEIVLETSVRATVLNIFSKEIISNNT